ncbi:MAG: MoaD/ThiS family protein [Proteobacteria bacterium]|nr:MoaD/ThiS family protein [Pseudomonadota bacterium]
MSTIRILFFAALREQLGAELAHEIAPGTTVADVRTALRARGEPWATLLDAARGTRTALNQALCGEQATLRPGDELAFFPPVTGG